MPEMITRTFKTFNEIILTMQTKHDDVCINTNVRFFFDSFCRRGKYFRLTSSKSPKRCEGTLLLNILF